MNECFSEKQLLSHCLGESTEAEQAHLRTCIVCAKRFKQMTGRMDLITQTLSRTPPPPSQSYVPVLLPRIVTAAIAIAVVFTLGLWSGQRLGTHRSASAPANLGRGRQRHGFGAKRYQRRPSNPDCERFLALGPRHLRGVPAGLLRSAGFVQPGFAQSRMFVIGLNQEGTVVQGVQDDREGPV